MRFKTSMLVEKQKHAIYAHTLEHPEGRNMKWNEMRWNRVMHHGNHARRGGSRLSSLPLQETSELIWKAGTWILRPESISQAMDRCLRWHLTYPCSRCPQLVKLLPFVPGLPTHTKPHWHVDLFFACSCRCLVWHAPLGAVVCPAIVHEAVLWHKTWWSKVCDAVLLAST